MVLNLDISVAMTQNYCNTGNFKHVWLKTAKGRPRFCHKWYRTLKKLGREDLIAMAHEVSRNNPEHFPNLAANLSSSDSSSDTSSASSDSSASVEEVVEPQKAKVMPISASTSSSSSSSSSAQEVLLFYIMRHNLSFFNSIGCKLHFLIFWEKTIL